MPPLMPAAKLRPVGPSTTTRPPVMYSQPWSPTPSTTASTPRVADGEALAREAAEERAAGGRAVEHGVADRARSPRRRTSRPRAGARTARRRTCPCPRSRWRRPSSEKRDAGRQPARRSSGRRSPRAFTTIVSSGRPSAPWRRGDLAGQQAADRAVAVAARACSARRARRLSSAGLRLLDQLVVAVGRRAPGPGRARGGAARRRARRAAASRCVRSTPRAFQCSIASSVSSRSVRPDEVLEAAHAERGHVLADLLGDEEEEVDDVLGLAAGSACAAPGPGSRCRPGTCSGGRRAS